MMNHPTQISDKTRLVRFLTSWVVALGLSLPLIVLSSYFASSALAQSRNDATLPTAATAVNFVNGDLKCYVTLADDSGQQYQDIGATFEVCQNADTYLNNQVSWQYGLVPVSDCQSAEPCGKTRIETLITQMQVLSDLPAPQVGFIGAQEETRSYNLNVFGSGDILFVRCPENYAPKLGYLSDVEALQCERF